ncbi:TPA: nucleoside hydrolase [Escherichia coli]|nr:nucleoside hydrolase [Escherichia coli]
MRLPIFLDTDPGIDDAVAIAAAIFAPELDLQLMTTVAVATLPELNRTGKMLHALFSHYRSGSMQSGLRMHDLCAIAWLVRPDLFTLKPCFVAVETQGEFTSGTTVVDIDGCLGKPANVQVALDLNVKGFQQWVAEVLALVP